MKIRKEKIMWFEERIADFFQKAGREHLPWRRKRITAYEVWVSEIMLQQTQVSRVIGYYERFLKRFPTVNDLAQASWEEFLPYYEGLGYYARGRNMLRAAQVILNEYNGKFPRDKKLLERVPGIGPYTAAAIMSFAYGDDHLAWDTNLRRVIGRFFFGTKNFLGHSERSEESRTKKDKRDSSRVLGMTIQEEAFWEGRFSLPKKDLNAALMDFGSALCVARPKCEACSLKSRCVYYKEKGKQEARYKKQETRKKQATSDKGQAIGQRADAGTIVFLHENHKKYFSSLKSRYEPFVMPAGYDTRARIKQYFKERYRLDVAVRPPHARWRVRGKLTLFVNAQILLGTSKFPVFSKNEAAQWHTEK